MILVTSLETIAALISPVAPVLVMTNMNPVMEQPTATTPVIHPAPIATQRRRTNRGPIVPTRGNAEPHNVPV